MSGVLPRGEMTRVTLHDLVSLGAAYRIPLHDAAARCGRETNV